MHGRRLNHRGPPGKLWGVCASVCLLIAAGGCEPGSPEIQASHDAPVELVLDTINVVHSDLLHYVRHVRRLSDGDLVVMNMGSFDVLLLDESWNLVGTVGRLGEGPGEFQGLLDMDTRGDSILVLDGLTRRVLLFHRDSFVTSWSLRGITGTPGQVAFNSGGAPVVSFAKKPKADRAEAMQVLLRIGDPADSG